VDAFRFQAIEVGEGGWAHSARFVYAAATRGLAAGGAGHPPGRPVSGRAVTSGN